MEDIVDDILTEEAEEQGLLLEWGRFRPRNPQWLNQMLNDTYKLYIQASDPKSEKYNPNNKKYFVPTPTNLREWNKATGLTKTSVSKEDCEAAKMLIIKGKIRRTITDTLLALARGNDPLHTKFGNLEGLNPHVARIYADMILKSYDHYADKPHIYPWHPHHFASPLLMQKYERQFIHGLDNKLR